MDGWMNRCRDAVMKTENMERCEAKPQTLRKNLSHGFISSNFWGRAMDLRLRVYELAQQVPSFKLCTQSADAAQGISSNLAEGRGRRSVPEFILHLYAAKGTATTWQIRPSTAPRDR